jgi:hypothetical protein
MRERILKFLDALETVMSSQAPEGQRLDLYMIGKAAVILFYGGEQAFPWPSAVIINMEGLWHLSLCHRQPLFYERRVRGVEASMVGFPLLHRCRHCRHCMHCKGKGVGETMQ